MKDSFLNILLTIFLISISYFYLIGAKPLIVTSNSMAPLINKGDLIIVFEKKDYQLNDVISFKTKGELVTHRLVVKEKDYFKTKGDANSSVDFGLRAMTDVLGKVEIIIPFLGFLLIYFQSKYFLYLILIFGIFLLLKKGQNAKD